MKDEFELSVIGEETNIAPRRSGKKEKFTSRAPWYYLGRIGDIGFAIALPIVGGAIAGVFVDRLWSTTPKATLSLLFLGIIISFMNVLRTVQTILKEK